MLQSVESYKKVASILGEERVFPLMFFLGIQPNTDLEHRLLEEGYLSAGYNPLMLTPTSIRKLLYNPAPLNKFIAKACLAAWERKEGSRDPRTWTGSLSQTADSSKALMPTRILIRGIEGNSGREALLSLEEIIRSTSSSSATRCGSPRNSTVVHSRSVRRSFIIHCSTIRLLAFLRAGAIMPRSLRPNGPVETI